MDKFEAGPVEHKGEPPAAAASPAAPGTRRLLLSLAAVLLALMALAFYAARTQVPAVHAWDDDPPRWSWAWFTEPIEFDRWRRPGTEAPRLRVIAVSGDGGLMFAAGEQGVLLRSGDGGRTWSGRRIVGAGAVTSVAIGAAGGVLVLDSRGALWRSADAGRSWTASLPAGSGLRAVAYAPQGQMALAVGAAGVSRTQNHGQNWVVLAANVSPALAVPRQSVSKAGVGPSEPACDKGMVFSGKTNRCEPMAPRPPQQNVQQQAVQQQNVQRQSPPPERAPAQELPRKSLPKQPQPKASLPPPATAPQAVAAPAPLASLPQFRSVVVTGAQTAVATDGDGVWLSDDGGSTWTRALVQGPAGLRISGFARQGDTLFVLGDKALLRSTDRGRSFLPVYQGAAPVRALALAPQGKGGVAVTEQGQMLASNDGGSWVPAKVPPARRITALATANGQALVATDDAGRLVRAARLDDLWSPVGRYERYPAPWFAGLAGFLVLPPIGAGLVAWKRRRQGLAKKGLLDNGVSDEPISRTEQDRLAFAPAVEALATFLRHSATTPPLAIAVNAPWGMGKTSFMRMLVGRLKQLGARPVWFNVWHHQHEEVLLAPLLRAIAREAIPSWWRWQGWRFRARLVFRRMMKLNNWGVAASLVGLATIPLYLLCLLLRPARAATEAALFPTLDHLVRDVHAVWNFLLGGEWLAAAKSASFTDVLAAAFGALRSDPSNGYWFAGTVILFMCFYMLWTYLLRPFPASPAILAARLNSKFSVSQAEAKADFRQRFREHFGDVAHALAPRTLTIFIDDLDRCEPQKAAELLEAVNYLCGSGPCYVVLGMARELVEAQVASAHKTLAEEQAVLDRARGGADAQVARPEQDRLAYARKYLRKLVQLDVQLPTVDPECALYLLLQKRQAQGAQDAHKAAQARRQRLRELGGACFMPLTLLLALGIFAGSLVAQGRQTLETMESEAAVARKDREAKLEKAQAFLREARRFEHGLRLQADPARSAGVQLAALRSDADVVASHIKAVDAILPTLQKETGEGRGRGFDKLLGAAYAPHEAAVQRLRQEYLRQEGKPGDSDIAAAVALAAGGSGDAQADAQPVAGTGGDGAGGATFQDGDEPQWPYVLAALPVLLLGIAALTYRDRYVVEPTPQYEEAVATWQQQLLANRDTASPRELKRFMNVSRYVVARGQTDDPLKPDVPEPTIVEFSARWLITRTQGARGTPEALARDPRVPQREWPERERQARWFLQVVGDISG